MQENPFATRFTKPGQEFVPPVAMASLQSVVERFQRQGQCGQIVGPHGCGKTTLAYALSSPLRSAYREIQFLVIRRSGRLRLGVELTSARLGSGQGLLRVVDGVECLSPLQRRCLVKCCQNQDGGLLLTTHRVMLGVGVLQKLSPSLKHFQLIVEHLIRSPEETVEIDKVRDAFERHAGNYRESLMHLYDTYQRQLANKDG